LVLAHQRLRRERARLTNGSPLRLRRKVGRTSVGV
jgi:hypothetical protein